MTAQEAAKFVNYAFLLFPPMLIVFMVANAWYLKRMREILSYLEQHQTAAWEYLGKPTLFKNNAPGHTPKILRFLYRREYTGIGDSVLTAKCESVRRILLKLVIAEGSFMLLFLFMFVLESVLKAS